MEYNKEFFSAGKKIKLDDDILDFTLDKKGSTSVFVPMDYYYLSLNKDNMCTDGISTCCGLFISNESYNFLLHISPRVEVKDVLSLLNNLNILSQNNIYIFPGSLCEYNKLGNKFNFEELIDKLQTFNNNIFTRKFEFTSGAVYYIDNKLIIRDKNLMLIDNFNENEKEFKM